MYPGFLIQELSLGGFTIQRKAGDQETLFKFHRTVKLEPGATATVWSADSGATHEPPRDIVMKGQKWFVADNITTTLFNNDQEVRSSQAFTNQRVCG